MTQYVTEFRLPVEVEASSPSEAAILARRRLENETGIDVGSWFIRVFEYGDSEDEIGIVREFFCSPGGTKFREIDANDKKHEKVVKDGADSGSN